VAQAQAEGVSLDQFVSRKLQTLVGESAVTSDCMQAGELTQQWESSLDEWLDSFPQLLNSPVKLCAARTGIRTADSGPWD